MATPDLKKNPRLVGEIAKSITEGFWVNYEKQVITDLSIKATKACLEDVKTSKLHIAAQIIKTEILRSSLQAFIDDFVVRNSIVPDGDRLVVTVPRGRIANDIDKCAAWTLDYVNVDNETYKICSLLRFVLPEDFDMFYRDCFTD